MSGTEKNKAQFLFRVSCSSKYTILSISICKMKIFQNILIFYLLSYIPISRIHVKMTGSSPCSNSQQLLEPRLGRNLESSCVSAGVQHDLPYSVTCFLLVDAIYFLLFFFLPHCPHDLSLTWD